MRHFFLLAVVFAAGCSSHQSVSSTSLPATATRPAPSKIGEFQGEYRFLSNFWPAPVEFEGITYPSVEHAYQSAKTMDMAERRDALEPKHTNLIGEIRVEPLNEPRRVDVEATGDDLSHRAHSLIGSSRSSPLVLSWLVPIGFGYGAGVEQSLLELAFDGFRAGVLLHSLVPYPAERKHDGDFPAFVFRRSTLSAAAFAGYGSRQSWFIAFGRDLELLLLRFLIRSLVLKRFLDFGLLILHFQHEELFFFATN